MKTILITGASRGIGLELAGQCLQQGHRVLGTCRDPAGAKELQELAGQPPGNLEILQLNVEEEASIHEVARELENRGEAVDILFNNAGIIDWRTMAEVDADSMLQVYKVNVVGAMMVLRSFIPILGKAESPLVVNLSSRLGSITLRGNTQLGGAIAYSASKAALNMLTKQASIDLAGDGITVVSISPGWVRTDMGGKDAKYSVRESVERILQNVASFTPEATGKFFGEDGETLPY